MILSINKVLKKKRQILILKSFFSFKFTLVLVYTYIIANTKKGSILQSSCTGIEYAWYIALNTLEYGEVLFPNKVS